jgi:beta-lactamase regulating signal transducer with metallopeptidase domain
MDTFVSEILLPGALRATAALALAAAAVFAARRASATLRHRLWVLGLGAALVVPFLAPFTPQLGLLPVPMRPVASASAPLPEAPPAPPAPGVEALAAVEQASAPLVLPLPAATSAGPFFSTLVVALWLAGALAVTLGRAAGLLARRRLRRSARPMTDPAWSELTAELGRAVGVNRPVTLLTSPAAGVPMTWGTRRPVVLLPAEARSWPQDRRRAVLLHELAHVSRGDAALGALAFGACALHWPNPLVWLAARRLRAEAEHAADDQVLARGERAALYAGHLLAVARALVRGAQPPRPVLAMARAEGTSSLSRRIGAILDGDRPRGEGRAWVRFGTVGLALVATALLAGVGCIQVDGLQSSMSYSDTDDEGKPPRGYFAADRFAGQCEPSLISGKRRSIHVRTHRSGRHEIELRHGSCELEVDLEGAIRLDDTSIVEIGSDASLSVEEKSGLGRRSLTVTAGPGGAPALDYRVDGTARPLDDDARAFLARVILEIQRSTAVGAADRVARFLAKGGLPAVLGETGELSTDYLRSVYLQELLEQAHPRGADLGLVLGAVTTLINSDYESGQILQSVAKNAAGDEPLPAEFFGAAGAIESDFERSQVLQAALDRKQVSETELTAALTAARALDSDYERGQVLKRALDKTALPEPSALEVVRSVEALESDYEASQVLGTLIAKRALSPTEIDAVIAAITRLGSDYERAQVLIALAQANRLEGAALDRYVAAAEAIGSEYDRDRSLAAALRNRG